MDGEKFEGMGRERSMRVRRRLSAMELSLSVTNSVMMERKALYDCEAVSLKEAQESSA